MPQPLEALPDVSDLLRGNLSADASFFLEVFCGAAIVTLCMVMKNVPCIRPWDVKYGDAFNVLKHGQVLEALISATVLVSMHFATPCTSMTWARWPQLRSPEEPHGKSELTGKSMQLVHLGNELLAFTLKCCLLLLQTGGYFSIENPELSWLWLQEGTLQLQQMAGVCFVRVLFKDFGVPFYKPTLFLHNVPTLHRLNSFAEAWEGPTVALRGLMLWEGRLQFRTHVAQTYPPKLGEGYAQLMSEALALREKAACQDLPTPQASNEQAETICLPPLQAAWLDPSKGVPVGEDVPNGLGAVKGLDPIEHVQWAEGVEHPSMKGPVGIMSELVHALQYEVDHEAEEIDTMRKRKLYSWIHRAKQFEQERKRWLADAPKKLQPLLQSIHGPLFKQLLKEASDDDVTFSRFMQDLHQGFPLVGDLPPCEGSCVEGVPKSTPKVRYETSQLRSDRQANNASVLRAVRDMEYSEDIMPQAVKDAGQYFMTKPRRLTSNPKDVSLTRRIPVREERQSGWRTRVVDHATESLINEATRPCDRVKNDTLDTLVFMLTFLFAQGVNPAMWKRDISSAFRRVPIFVEHLDLAWIVWLCAGLTWTAGHVGMPFGTVSAVYAWHRVGHALFLIIVKCLKAPMGRYVDDYFGASRSGVEWNGGACLTVLASLLGFPTDDAKSADSMIYMIVLGASVSLDWSKKLVSMCVDQAKADKWVVLLRQLVVSMKCTSDEAAKMAGRLNFSVTVQGNRVGRAFIKPFYAQHFAPMSRDRMNSLLVWAVNWFIRYLTLRPSAVRRGVTPRPLLVSWSDAAGASTWIAAVVRWKGTFFWTRVKTPRHILQQLTPREDSQIGFQELLGLVLVLGTFPDLVSGSLWVGFCDNDGVTHALSKGGGHNTECNLLIGKVCLHLASVDCDLHVGRVESKSNIADGPTREDLSLLEQLEAVFVSPILPEWISDIWHVKD